MAQFHNRWVTSHYSLVIVTVIIIHYLLFTHSISSSVPQQVASLTRLASLHLGDNSLSGSIGSGMQSLTGLKYALFMENPQLDMDLSAIKSWKKLIHAVMYGMSITGTIPNGLMDGHDKIESILLGPQRLSNGI